MSNGTEQPPDKGGMVGRLFGSASNEPGKGLMIIAWVSPATLEEFRKVMCNPSEIQAFAEQLKTMGEKEKKDIKK